MPNFVNQMVARELESEFESCDGMVIVSFGGLTIVESEALRNQLAQKSIGFRMVQNRLARKVLADRGLEFPAETLKGNTAIAYGDAEAAINAAKILTDRAVKKLGKVKVKGGVLEGQALDEASANALADLPDRNTLNAQLLGVISGPARALACLVNALPASVARVIQAHADQDPSAQGQDPAAVDAGGEGS
ncbi:MAG: 50S ribosomal protein L10 [Planctomycetota bacterium]